MDVTWTRSEIKAVRNPVDCVRELIGNPTFCEVMGYAPERQFADEELLERLLNEMWTADW